MHVAKGHVYADGVRVSDPDAALAGCTSSRWGGRGSSRDSPAASPHASRS